MSGMGEMRLGSRQIASFVCSTAVFDVGQKAWPMFLSMALALFFVRLQCHGVCETFLSSETVASSVHCIFSSGVDGGS